MKVRSQSSSIPTKHFRRPRTQKNAVQWTKSAVLRELKRLANPRVRAKMAYFGVNVPKSLGISAPVLHALARRIGRDHRLAQDRKSTRLNSSHLGISYAVFCLK